MASTSKPAAVLVSPEPSAATGDSGESSDEPSRGGTPLEGTPPGSIFYLEVGIGCYAMDEGAKKDFFIDAVGKSLVPIDCAKPHHFEVISSKDVHGFDGGRNLTQDDAQTHCLGDYKAVFGQDAPDRIISQKQQLRSPYLYWFFPDDGLEAKTYPGRLICGVFTADPKYTKMLSRKGSLVAQSA